MKIIEFPTENKIKMKVKKVREKASEKYVAGPFSVTCANCSTIAKFNFENMIFKSIDYYCPHCGQKYQIVNPAFTKDNI